MIMMGLGTSYQGAIFFMGIVAILLIKCESKQNVSLDQQNEPKNFDQDTAFYLQPKTRLDYIENEKTPAPLKPTATQLQTVTISSNNLQSKFASKTVKPNPILELYKSQRKQTKCEQLKNGYIREVAATLSPEILSQADPFRYLVDKTIKIHRNMIVWVRSMLNNYLRDDYLPRCYVPYAEALSSLLLCWPDMSTAKDHIVAIQKRRFKKEFDPSSLSSDVPLSSELLELFSDEFYDDPDPPLRIFYKLIEMSENDLLNLETQLAKFIEQACSIPNILITSSRYYIWYAEAVWKFLQNKSAFDDLKRNMAAIQHLANSG